MPLTPEEIKARQREYARKKREHAIANGLCPNCDRRKPAPPFRYCEHCRASVARCLARNRRSKKDGECHAYNCTKPTLGYYYCPEHYIQHRKREKK